MVTDGWRVLAIAFLVLVVIVALVSAFIALVIGWWLDTHSPLDALMTLVNLFGFE